MCTRPVREPKNVSDNARSSIPNCLRRPLTIYALLFRCHSPIWFTLRNATSWEWEIPNIVPVYSKEYWCWMQLFIWIQGF